VRLPWMLLQDMQWEIQVGTFTVASALVSLTC
jgi:hypothetical protein